MANPTLPIGRAGEFMKQLIMPTTPLVVLYAVVSVLLLSFLNINTIWDDFSRALLLRPEDIGTEAATANESGVWYTLTHSSALQILFWALVGTITYALIWFIRSIVINLRNDLVADEYVHPAAYDRSGYWGSIIFHKILFGASIIILLAYTYTNIKLQPLLAGVSYAAIKDFQLVPSTLKLIAILASAVLLMHIFVIIVRVAANSWQYIYKDL